MLLNLLVLANAFHLAAALYSKEDAVIQLNPLNWKQEVDLSPFPVLVEFYAPWCGHCKNLAPEYKKAAESLKGFGKIAAVDCDEHKDLCGKYGIQGFPTLKMFQADKFKPVLDYNGARKADSISNYYVNYLASKVVGVNESPESKEEVTLEGFLHEEDIPHVLLFSTRKGNPPMYKSLSVEYDGKIKFGQVASSDTVLAKKLDVSQPPALFVYPTGENETPVRYSGQFKIASLKPFLDKYVAKGDAKSAGQEATIYEIKSQKDLKTHCLDKNIACFVAFLALEPEYPESVKQHKDNLAILENARTTHSDASVLNIVWINALEHGKQLMKDADVSDLLPGMIVLHGQRSFYRNYRGAFDQEGVEGFISDVLKGKGKNVPLGFDVVLDKEKKKVEKDEL